MLTVRFFFGGDQTDGSGKLIVQSGGVLELGDTVSNGQTVSALMDQEGVGGQSDFVLSGGIIKLINSGLTTAMPLQLVGGVQSTVDTNGKTALLSGLLSGDGGLTKAGDGTLTLLGANTYTGPTDILSGTLKLSGSGTISSTEGVHNNGQLDIADVAATSVALRSMDGSGAVTLGGTTLNLTDGNATFGNIYSGVIAGSGGLTVSGGATILTGQSTYTGGTDVQAGTLEVDGSLLSQVSVRDGATLAGQGSVGGARVYAGASLSPGSAAGGLLRVTGDLSMASGSTLLANSLSATHELVQVGGTATLSGGTVQIAGAQSLQEDEHYTLLTAASGVVGRYDAVKFDQLGDYPFLAPTLSYTPDTVSLQFLRNTTPFSALAQTRNQLAAGYGLQSVAAASSVVRAVVQLGGVGAVHAALDALSGEIHASARTVLLQDSLYVRQAMADRLAGTLCGGGAAGQGPHAVQLNHAQVVEGEGCAPDRAVLWGEAYGGFGHNGGDGNAASVHHSTAGFIMGVDRALGAEGQWRTGGLVSYGRSMLQSGGRSSSGQSNNVTLGGYGGTHWGRLNLRVGVSYTWNMLALNRTVAFAGFGNTLSSHYNGGTAQGFGELGYRFRTRGVQLEPFGNVAYVNQHTNQFREQGGVAALRGRATDTGVTFATFGLRVSSGFWARGVWVTPHATLGYRHAFGQMVATTHESFVAGSGTYGMDVAGMPLSSDVAMTDAGVGVKLTDRVDIGLSYIGQYGGLFASSGAHGRVTFRF
ncbi:MAG: autotransporter domain-containing protein [Acetobacter sp.]